MIIDFTYNEELYQADLSQPIDLSMPLIHGATGPKCFYAPDVHIEPVVAGDFVGSTAAGAPVNFKNVLLNPHGNGTHTECVGHIATEEVNINEVLSTPMTMATVVTVTPEPLGDSDLALTTQILRKAIPSLHTPTLILRTLPNDKSKQTRDYSGTNPPYITTDAMHYLVSLGVQHLMLDLPSVDRELDDGLLMCHKIFWDYPARIDKRKTITELIFVNESVPDGLYLCDIQIINLNLDASPSRPLLYKIDKK